MSHSTQRIAITGGAGQIAYQLLFRIANGDLLGKEQPIAISILEIPEALPALEGVKMELEDCAFPLLQSIEITSDPYRAFKDVDFALLIGAKPRGPGMERKDLLQENGKIFVVQGKALNESAKDNVKVFVVGNPCNTNCLIAMSHAPRLSRKNFSAMMRLDQNRAAFQLAQKANVPIEDVSHVIIWGNHSSTQVPDFSHARIKGCPVETVIHDHTWLKRDFIQLVQKRGASIIQARGKSSAASAAHALIEAVHDALQPTQADHWYSSAKSSEDNPYDVDDHLVFSFPYQTLDNGDQVIVQGLGLHEFLEIKLRESERELIEERELIQSFI